MTAIKNIWCTPVRMKAGTIFTGAAMQTETIGKYQVHLVAHELPGGRAWDPFVTILKFDDAAGDFRCVIEKRRVSETPAASYEEAIEMARRVGTAMVQHERL
jgi:hypothetical protein